MPLLAFAVGVLTALAGVLAGIFLPFVLFRADADPPSDIVLAGLLVGLAGLVWMIRIYRGPRDGPPPWRHRDR